jgi:hypothetical protein
MFVWAIILGTIRFTNASSLIHDAEQVRELERELKALEAMTHNSIATGPRPGPYQISLEGGQHPHPHPGGSSDSALR